MSAQYLNDKNIFIARNGLFFSNNSGSSFKEIGDLSQYGGSIFGIYFSTEKTGLIIGKDGNVLTTDNGGTNWEVKKFYPGYVRGLQFITNKKGFVYGGASQDGLNIGELYKTTDGGKTFTSIAVENNITAAYFRNENVGYYVGLPHKVYKTMDGGQTWTFLKSLFDGNDYVTSISGIGNQKIYVATMSGKLIATKDDFTTTKELFDTKGTSFNKLCITSDSTVWCVGNSGIVVKGRE